MSKPSAPRRTTIWAAAAVTIVAVAGCARIAPAELEALPATDDLAAGRRRTSTASGGSLDTCSREPPIIVDPPRPPSSRP